MGLSRLTCTDGASVVITRVFGFCFRSFDGYLVDKTLMVDEGKCDLPSVIYAAKTRSLQHG